MIKFYRVVGGYPFTVTDGRENWMVEPEPGTRVKIDERSNVFVMGEGGRWFWSLDRVSDRLMASLEEDPDGREGADGE